MIFVYAQHVIDRRKQKCQEMDIIGRYHTERMAYRGERSYQTPTQLHFPNVGDNINGKD